ncbi:MAG: FMN-binding protein [Candidatus Marinimicrobia bacterium]|nr:FMN-binding protein [Candidatus Neomarinimicrobiota bacterium]
MNKNSAIYTFTFIFLICVVFGLAISLVHYSTLETLAKNEALNRNRVICNAFLLKADGESPKAYQQAIDQNINARILSSDTGNFETFFRRDSENPDVGFVFSGMGFWDRIEGIIVLTSDLSQVINIQFLDQKETPGLGARIEEKWFTDQFKGLEIDWTGRSDQRLIVGASSRPNITNRVDAITGASQTSLALEKLLNSELNQFREIYNRYQSEKE